MDGLKITVSGYYKTASGDMVDYIGVSGVVPKVDESVYQRCVQARYIERWLREDKRFSERVSHVMECAIEKVEEVKDADFSYVGKDVREMDANEIQDFATAFDLWSVPRPRMAQLRGLQRAAYVEYSNKVLGTSLNENDEGFNLMALPALVVGDATRKEVKSTVSNEEAIADAQQQGGLSMADLKALARQKGIPIQGNISEAELRKRVFGE